MKKAFLLSFVVLFFVATFSSCFKQADDIYKPKCKIVNIWYDEMTGVADEIYTYEDKELSKITYSEDGSYLLITHNKNGTISEIKAYDANGVDIGESVTMTYDKTLIATMSYIDDGTVYEKYVFTHVDKKISSIKLFLDNSVDLDKLSKSKLYKRCFGDPDQFGKLFEINGSKGLDLYLEYLLTYTGDNLTKIHYVKDYITMTQTMEYDNMKNPYFGLNLYLGDFLGYTKNNLTKVTITTVYNGVYEETFSDVYNYTYQYNKYDFPTSITREDDEGNIENTFIEYDKK